MRAVMMVAGALLGAASAWAQAPLYASLVVGKPANSGCQVAATREALATQLHQLGYNAALPAIAWQNGNGAVIVLSADGNLKPFRYGLIKDGETVRVVMQTDDSASGQYLFVMQIGRKAAAAANCVIARATRENLMISSPRAVTSEDPGAVMKGSTSGEAVKK